MKHREKAKNAMRVFLCALLVFTLCVEIREFGIAEANSEFPVIRIKIEINAPLCGEAANSVPYCNLGPLAAVEQGEPCIWVSSFQEDT